MKINLIFFGYQYKLEYSYNSLNLLKEKLNKNYKILFGSYLQLLMHYENYEFKNNVLHYEQ